jgi:hypothetical protein
LNSNKGKNAQRIKLWIDQDQINSYPQKESKQANYPRSGDTGNRALTTCFSIGQDIVFSEEYLVIHRDVMPLLLRLFFIRGSKNNQRRSHAGSEGRTVFQKTGEPGCLEPVHVQKRDCSSEIGTPVFKKFRSGSHAMAVRTKTRHSCDTAGMLWNSRFSTAGCALDVEDFRKTRPARRTQADAPEAVVGCSKKFNPLLPACRRTAHPDREQQIRPGKGNHEN